MKKIIRFYAICCLGNCIYHYIVDYIFVLYGDTDLYYGFIVGIWFIFMLYAPLCTLSAYIFINSEAIFLTLSDTLNLVFFHSILFKLFILGTTQKS